MRGRGFYSNTRPARGGGFSNKGAAEQRNTSPSNTPHRSYHDNTPRSQTTDENDGGFHNRNNRFSPSKATTPKKDGSKGRGESSWAAFGNKSAPRSDQNQGTRVGSGSVGNSAGLDSWDPLKEDFKNNSYVDRDNRRGGSNDPSIHVSNIPPSMEDDGLRNIFCGKLPQLNPTRVCVAPLKEGHRNKFGFLHYPTIEQCEEAIRVMDGHLIGTTQLRVNLGKKSVNRASNEFPRSGNYGNQAEFHRSGDGFTVRRSEGSPSRYSESSQRSGSHGGAAASSSLRTDRQTNQGDSFQPRPSVDPVKPQVPAAGAAGNHGNNEPANPGNKCANCGNPASNACKPCGGTTYYCGATCQMADWPKHQMVCKGQPPAEKAISPISSPNQKQAAQVPQSNGAAAVPQDEESSVILQSFPKVSIPETCQCLWVFGTSPLDFWVQLTDHKTTIEDITETMYSIYSEIPLDPSFEPEEGDVVAAIFQEDWYRAQVLHAGWEKLKVRYIDYGNASEVSRNEVKRLRHLQNIMPQAIPCRLHDLTAPHEHSEEVMKFFTAQMSGSGGQLGLKKIKEEAGVFHVELTLKTGEDLGDLLVANGHASRLSAPKGTTPLSLPPYKSPESDIELNKTYEVSVPYITNINEMYISLVSTVTGLMEVTNHLQSYVNNAPRKDPVSEKQAVVTMYEGMASRGLVLALLPNNKVKVKFVDFGNIEVFGVDEVFRMPQECLELPQQAIKCRLELSTVELVADHETLVQYLKSQYPESKAVQGTFIRKEGDTFIVKLNHCDGPDELSKLLQARLVRTKTGATQTGATQSGVSRGPPLLTTVSNKRKIVFFKPADVTLPVGSTLQTSICNISTPTRIHANFMSPAQEGAADFLAQVQSGGDGGRSRTFSNLATKPEVDELVICFSGEHSEWFRAVVKSVYESSCTVYSLDYGLTDDINFDSMVPAEEIHNSVPPLAFNISFQGAEKILARLRDTVSKAEWQPILQLLLLQQPFDSLIVSQDALDVVIKVVGFDFIEELKQKIRPIVERRKPTAPSSGSGSTASTPPPPPNNTAAAPATSTAGPQYIQITKEDWQNIVITIDNMRRALRNLGQDV